MTGLKTPEVAGGGVTATSNVAIRLQRLRSHDKTQFGLGLYTADSTTTPSG